MNLVRYTNGNKKKNTGIPLFFPYYHFYYFFSSKSLFKLKIFEREHTQSQHISAHTSCHHEDKKCECTYTPRTRKRATLRSKVKKKEGESNGIYHKHPHVSPNRKSRQKINSNQGQARFFVVDVFSLMFFSLIYILSSRKKISKIKNMYQNALPIEKATVVSFPHALSVRTYIRRYIILSPCEY